MSLTARLVHRVFAAAARGRTLKLAIAIVAVQTVVSAGCSSNPIQAKWSDPQFANHPLAGAKVLVACDADDTPIVRLCEDTMSARLVDNGAVPVRMPAPVAGSGTAGTFDQRVLDAAREAGAKAVLVAAVAPDRTVVSPGPSVGFGLGGFGGFGGTRSGGVGGGVGISVPVGASRTRTAYAADMVLKDVGSGKVMWTAKVAGPESQDINSQLDRIARVGLDSARQSGLF